VVPDDPPAFEVLNPRGSARLLLVCDHASKTIPPYLGGLGLTDEQLEQHIAIDIGAGDVTRRLAERFDAPAILAGYSRLVVDVNRSLDDDTAFITENDGIAIPGNVGLGAREKNDRIEACYAPYHAAIDSHLQGLSSRNITPAFIAIHSFTPLMGKERRPWEVGILWDKDPRISTPLMQLLRDTHQVRIGDNLPYSGRHPADFTVDHHAEAAGLAHVGIEIRNDLISDTEGVNRMATLLGDCIEVLLEDESLYQEMTA
jgi:predicted N-formylglutamate amidohydrolase